MWAMYGWSAEIIDVKTAWRFRGRNILKIPEGYREYKGDNLEGKCLILQHVIYGLVQAARQFYKNLKEILETKLVFRKCMSNQCLYPKKDEVGVIMICLYIDDTLRAANQNAIEKFKKDIKEFFVTKEGGEVTEYVGCMIRKNQETIYLHQTDLIKNKEVIWKRN